MRKRYLLFFVIFLFMTGCENQEEAIKNEYIAMKNQAFNDKNYKVREELPVEIITTIERIDEEEIHYKVTIKNPKENMRQVKAMVVHNYYTEDIFPSLGLFDDKESLIVGDESVKGIELVGYIETTKNIDKLNLQLKIWIEYIDDNGEVKDIYYKTT